MILVPCFSCLLAVRVMGEEMEVSSLIGQGSDFWPDKYTCIECEKNCAGLVEESLSVLDLAKFRVRDLSPTEMLAAQHGFGTPEETDCTSAAVQEQFKKKLKNIAVKNLGGTTRSCIEYFEFVDGSRLYVASAPEGAVVYRITKPHSYVKSHDERSP